MGAVLQNQQIDPRLAELERAAYNDMQGQWARACWICRATGACRHREAELIAIWRQQ